MNDPQRTLDGLPSLVLPSTR